jgi:sugar lactone lactonase YvrE
VPRPTSYTFGGPNRETLYVTSVRIRLSAQQLAEVPLSGSVLAIDSCGRGLAESVYVFEDP